MPACRFFAMISRTNGLSSAQVAIAANQRVGGTVMLELGLRGTFQLGNNRLGEDLAQLHAPLIERVDVPDRALSEHVVFVEGDQASERARGELFGEDHVGR